MEAGFRMCIVATRPWSNPCPLVRNPDDSCPHLLEGVINVIGDRRSILVVGTVRNFRTLRFVELKRKLESISPKTLAEKLRRLEAAGLVRRQSYNEVPPRVKYSLTRNGEAHRSAMTPLLRWAARRVMHESGPPSASERARQTRLSTIATRCASTEPPRSETRVNVAFGVQSAERTSQAGRRMRRRTRTLPRLDR